MQMAVSDTPHPPYQLRDDNYAGTSYGTGAYASTSSGVGTNASTSYGAEGVYSDDKEPNYEEYKTVGKGLSSVARVLRDGRISVSLSLTKKLPDLPQDHAVDVEEFGVDKINWFQCPSLNIVIMIVGSRGDVQPYVALGKRLVKDGHRVRIASHETFRSFVTEAGLEFFAIGGDPHDLMSYMVKNPGMIPGLDTIMKGDIQKKRKMLSEMMNGCWQSCQAPCPITGREFVADTIISNPPAFAHIHCAEALGIPLLLSFTMPWSPTRAFPHPLVNVDSSNAERGLTNYLSYAMSEMLTWQGIGDLVNKLRVQTLELDPLSVRNGPGLVDMLKVPWTYCMSPALVPKPMDWKNHIDVVGFYFLDLSSNYTPPDDLTTFLAAGPPPIYIGFGSVVIDDPAAMTQMIFKATAQAGVRALVSAGWGELGGQEVPSHIFILGNIPHDWLFDKGRVAAVIHHGGAGTTAIGLSKGLPTFVVPFFGDQAFWGNMIYKAGAGPAPIHHKKLNVENLTASIRALLSRSAGYASRAMADQIRMEDGINRGAECFYRHLPLNNMRCDIDSSRLAVWWSTKYCLKLSAFATQVLVDARLFEFKNLDLHRSMEYDTKKEITDPVTGGVITVFWMLTYVSTGVAQIFTSPVKGIINTSLVVPKTIVKMLNNVYDGFGNTPKLYGTEIRKQGKVTDFKSGLMVGGKGFFYGFYDGIVGLVRDPRDGAKKEGFVGAMKGTAKGLANISVMPASGAMGLVIHPFNGAWKSAKAVFLKKREHAHVRYRISDGINAVRRSTPEERQNVLTGFQALKVTTKERREHYAKVASQALYESAASRVVVPESNPGSLRPDGRPSASYSTPNLQHFHSMPYHAPHIRSKEL